MSTRSAVLTAVQMFCLTVAGIFLAGLLLGTPNTSQAAQKSKWNQKAPAAASAEDAADDTEAAPQPVSSSKRKVARSRKDMILEVELKALKEALAVKQDEESTTKFVTKADQEFQNAQAESTKVRELLTTATAEATKVSATKQTILAVIEKVKAAVQEVQDLAQSAGKESKLAGVEIAATKQQYEDAKQEVVLAEARETSAMDMLDRAQQKETYYRELVKRRMQNAEDFYYIAEAALKKGGNAQSMEFAIKAKAEMEQAKIAENEANIRAEAVKAAEKVVESRKQSTETARTRLKASAQLMKLVEEIAISLKDAAEAARLSAQAAQTVMAKAQTFAAAQDEVGTFVNKKVETLTTVKDSAEKKEALAGDAAQSAKAVLTAKQKAQAEAEARAQSALAEARTLVIQTPAENQAPAAAPGASGAQTPAGADVPQAPASQPAAPAAPAGKAK